MKRAYFSLGSNIGDRRANIEAALEKIGSPRLRVTRISSFYETEPQNRAAQPWFLNLVAEVETDLFPRLLLSYVESVERAMGRQRKKDKGPRIIDIDILTYGQFIVRTPKLEIPHPGLAERRFVLEPLSELAPQWRHPSTRAGVLEMLAALKGQVVRKL